MSADLPKPIADYFAAANACDTRNLHDYFAEDAVVQDEREERRGVAAIRNWMKDTGEKYAAVAEVTTVVLQADDIVVAAKVTGNFPGSPATLHYTFRLRNDRIVHLEIH